MDTKLWTEVITKWSDYSETYLFILLYIFQNCLCIECLASKILWSLPET